MGSQKIKRKAECLPWKIPFEYRVRLLFQNHVNGFKNVVYLYEIADTSTFRYRAYNMCQALDESLYWRGSYFFETELERLKPYLKYIEVVIAVRFHWSDKLGDLFFALKALGIKVLFDVDDLVFEIKYFSELLESIGIKKESEMEVAFWKKYVTGLNHTAALCDGGITTNAYLARYLEEITGKGSFVIPNTFNSWQERISDELWRKKNEKTNKKENSDFILGYFSGSYTHEKDFAMIAEEVRDLLYAIPEMKLRVVGYMKLPDYMDSLIKPANKKSRLNSKNIENFIQVENWVSK